MPRLRPTVSDETYELIQQHAETHNLSMSAATWEFIEAGAKALYGVEPESPAPHGDVSRIKRMAEYKQCPRCESWNVGIYEGAKYCADCGWTPDD